MNEIYTTTNQSNIVTRTSSLKIFQPLRTKALSQKCLSYLGLFILNGLPDDVKLSNNVSTFKHKVKNTFLTLLREKDQHIYVYYGQITAIITSFLSWIYNTNKNIARIIFPCFYYYCPVFALFIFKTV